MDIAEWLRRLGLERYESTFRENNFDACVRRRPAAVGEALRARSRETISPSSGRLKAGFPEARALLAICDAFREGFRAPGPDAARALRGSLG